VKKYRLMSPGPTPVPDKVLLSMAQTIIHHRTPAFSNTLKVAMDNLKKVFSTKNPVLILASSGTGAMEASIVNFLSNGDKIIVVSGGKFGERFGEIAQRYGVNVINLAVEYGKAADHSSVKKLLDENKDVKAVYSTLCETSTGVVNDIKSIGELVSKSEAILIVDAISGLTADALKPDDWGVDIVVGGSQKGLMLPPGLAFLSISEKAKKLLEKSTLPKFYFDIKAYLKSYAKNDTPWTPAVSLVIGLNNALEMILNEGLENVLTRHEKLARATRGAVIALGLEIFAERPSNAVTSVKVPAGIDGTLIVKKMRDEEGVTIAGGQSELKGKIFRIAHLGYMDKYDCLSAISALEIVLTKLGFRVEMGKGVGKAQELLKDI